MRETRRLLGILNVVLAVCLAAPVLVGLVLGTADTGSLLFWSVFSAFTLLAGIGHLLGERWVVVLGAVPIIFLASFFTLAVLAGGWVWGPRENMTVQLLVTAGLALVILQLVSLSVAFFGPRRSPGTHRKGGRGV